MVSRSASGAVLLEPALHLPARADEANESLRPLRFRQAVRGSDLVALARLVEQGAVPPAVMSKAVARLQRLLIPAVLTQLKSIRFLETGPGTVTAPADAYMRSDRLAAILGEDAPYAAGMPATLLQRLGCRTEPRADDILAGPGQATGGRTAARAGPTWSTGRSWPPCALRDAQPASCGTSRSSGPVTGGKRPATAWSARTTAVPSSTP